jgi:Zn-dependent protease with chaperone function
MSRLVVVLLLALLVTGCATIQGHRVRASSPDEDRRVAVVLDPLLTALELPSLRTIAASSCKIGFAVVRTPRVNVWSSAATSVPCLHFSLFVTEGALKAPTDELTAMLAHELGHLVLRHTPQGLDAARPTDEAWHAVQAQELEADRFAVALMKRLPGGGAGASCEAMGRFLRRGVADWYGEEGVTTRLDGALNERVAAAEAACATADLALPPLVLPASLAVPAASAATPLLRTR